MGQIHEPRLAVTELQMFAHLGRGSDGGEKLNRDNLVNPGTLAEALYDTLIYHAAVRLQPFVELITHSATVNHGGGLRKERERVYANPCYYAEKFFADFGDAQPVKVSLQAPTERAPIVLPEIKNAGGETSFPIIAALAARAKNGELLISLVHRGTAGPVRLSITVDGFSPEDNASGWTLGGEAPWAANTLEHPNGIQPVAAGFAIKNNSLDLQLQSYSVTQLRLRPRK
jgi:alpha-N-arabinofuranosidase